MSGGSDNQLSFIFPDSVYRYLNTGEGEIPQTDCDRLVENINKFDKCYDNSGKLKNHLLGLLSKSQLNSETVSNISCITEEMKTKALSLKSSDDILNWCNKNFTDDYDWLNGHNVVFQKLKDMNLPNVKMLLDYFVFLNDEGKEVPINDVVFDKQPIGLISNRDAEIDLDAIDGGAYQQNNFGTDGKLRLNLNKDENRVPILFSRLLHTVYLTKRWRGENAEFGSSSSSSLTPSNLAECGKDFNSGLNKRHIKAWTPRDHGSSASTVNAMSHLRRMATQPRITHVDAASIPFMRAFGITGGSMDGGAQLELKFDNCESGNSKKDNLRIRQSTQYLDLFKSVVQRLNHHNGVDRSVIDKLTDDLNAYRNAECNLFKDALRLANALKSQNNGSLPDKQPITSLDAFKEASDEVAKSETHLLGCLTKILTETCKKP